ncbi:class D beta-lactamase [Oryzomicrobium sp.]|uniref:class D beta-lactamase n=1 Tax=Oryzomicrobium sp. TaxID=1911578 RepID=UPI0025CBB17F|nr:class D beta-lactamase [Oryzomicrobium sp.]MCE1242991.1 class D beta-lactamase [Oryzomicrobium sp.]
MKKLFVLLLSLLALPLHASDWQDDPRLAAAFARAGLAGTFVVYDVAADRLIGHDRARAETRFIPASTFKIPNSLIGLDSGTVASVDQALPYGGKPQWNKAWEKDMGLREAIKVSNFPVYQELARRTGLARMQAGVKALGYGNGEIGTAVDRFWVDGTLTISAVEQTRFLARLARGELPVSRQAQADVREITLLESGPGWSLHAKTGWSDASRPDLGWWVGWVEKGGRVYAFALNIDMPPKPALDGALKARIGLGRECLGILGIL